MPRLRFLLQESFANVQGIGSISNARLEKRLGRLPETVLAEIRSAMAFALDLG
jgi:mRNA interferase MazF